MDKGTNNERPGGPEAQGEAALVDQSNRGPVGQSGIHPRQCKGANRSGAPVQKCKGECGGAARRHDTRIRGHGDRRLRGSVDQREAALVDQLNEGPVRQN